MSHKGGNKSRKSIGGLGNNDPNTEQWPGVFPGWQWYSGSREQPVPNSVRRHLLKLNMFKPDLFSTQSVSLKGLTCTQWSYTHPYFH